MTDLPRILLGSFERAPWGWALLGAVLVTLIKVWPVLALQAIEAKDRLRKERRDDLTDCQKAVAELREQFHQLEIKLLGAISAYRILDRHIEDSDPGCTALGQAREVMSTAFTLSPSTEAPAWQPPQRQAQ